MKDYVFQIFDSIGAFGGGGLGAITLLKMGVYSIFNEFLHLILVILNRMLWDHDERSVIILELVEP